MLLVVTQVHGGELESVTRRFDSEPEAIGALLEDVEVRVPDALTCLVSGEVWTLEDLRTGAEQPRPE